MGLQNLIGGLLDTKGLVTDTIKETLEKVATEIGCDSKGLFIMIKPYNNEFDFKCYVYNVGNGTPTLVREIPLAEILGEKKEE